MASVVDKPKESNQNDLLGIEKYTEGLIRFIEASATPITIGVQGEWGSGKTSLLNTIREELCNKDGKFHSIWLNTWEYSLLSSSDETLIKIISGLVMQIGSMRDEKVSEKGKKAFAVLGTFAKKFGGEVGGISGKLIEMAGEVAESTVNKPQDNSIKALRNALQDVIDETLVSHNKKAFIFFIDDLDRLDPAVAVQILELIKNLFDLENCIFVLAIDYSVVVKGLQSKFGVMTEENEWEFRAFFDKIIQLPFSMPISNYDISKYIKELLVKVNYFSQQDLDNERVLKKIIEVVEYSVGTNPRALVRLTNSVSLIEMIRTDEDNITVDEKIIEFALVCTQIAYPLIYGLIQKDPEFTEWGKEETLDILKSKNIDTSELDDVKADPAFDETWEQNLWKVCQLNSFLKQNVYRVSKLLNFIKENIPQSDDESLGETVERLLRMSSFTSVSADISKPQKRIRLSTKQKKAYMDTMEKLVKTELKSKYPDAIFSFYAKAERRNTWMRANVDKNIFDICIWTNQQKIKIYINAITAPNEIISWFENYMKDLYPKMIVNKQAKDGKKVIILDDISVKNSKEFMKEYQDIVVKTYNTILPKLGS